MARITKKDIYKQYGIDFDGNGHIYHNKYGWISCLLVDGNEKIGKGVYHFSTLPTNQIFHVVINNVSYDIMGTCPCNCKGCYATKGNFQRFPEKVLPSLAIRTLLIREDLDFVKRAIIAQIKADKISFVRIHASGDFDSLAYVETWQEIIKACADCVSWTYTKYNDAENAFDIFDNANIVKSKIPHYGFNFGHCDYILALYEHLKNIGESVYICRCGIDPQQHCNTCKGRSKHKYVLFLEHSTEYKADKDPLYDTLKAVIESQDFSEI